MTKLFHALERERRAGEIGRATVLVHLSAQVFIASVAGGLLASALLLYVGTPQ